MKNASKDSKAKGKKAIEFHDVVYSALASLLKNRVLGDKAQIAVSYIYIYMYYDEKNLYLS